LLRERKVKKEYCALAAAPVAVGRHVHFMQPARYAPRILSQLPNAGWFHCELEVQNCKQVPWPSPAIQEQFLIGDCGWVSGSNAYECPVRLLTGRTHQVMKHVSMSSQFCCTTTFKYMMIIEFSRNGRGITSSSFRTKEGC
jgi:hypothetical protein